MGSLQRLLARFPAGQFWRFIGVGIWNTVVGYATFALFAFLLSAAYPNYGYIAAGFLASVVNMTVAFLGYKWFVFKTSGHYLGEWLRCMLVASSGILLGLLLLPVLVWTLTHMTRLQDAAPYVAGAIIAGANALYNFIGHSSFTFKSRLGRT